MTVLAGPVVPPHPAAASPICACGEATGSAVLHVTAWLVAGSPAHPRTMRTGAVFRAGSGDGQTSRLAATAMTAAIATQAAADPERWRPALWGD